MDISTGIGIVGAFGIFVLIILIDGGNFAQYMDKHATIIILGGTLMATVIRYPFPVLLHALPQGFKKAMSMRVTNHKALVEEITQIAEVARKQGPNALEKVDVSDPVLAQGVRYIADGYDADFIRASLEFDKDNIYMQLDEAQKIYRSMGDCAPAFGMIGTLLGMVNMFSNMSDPSTLGPFMATALLATLYGAIVANALCTPLADKIHVKMAEEDIARAIIIEGVVQIRNSKSPALVKEMLLAFLTDHDRHALSDQE